MMILVMSRMVIAIVMLVRGGDDVDDVDDADDDDFGVVEEVAPAC